MLLWRAACVVLDEVAKIIGRQVCPVRKVRNRRCFLSILLVIIICFKVLVKIGYSSVIQFFSCIKLAAVELLNVG